MSPPPAAQAHVVCMRQLVLSKNSANNNKLQTGTKLEGNAVSEDRTHDLRIMRPTRYQLRYHRLEMIAQKCGGMRWDRSWLFICLFGIVVALEEVCVDGANTFAQSKCSQ